jgi:hypothetical protein
MFSSIFLILRPLSGKLPEHQGPAERTFYDSAGQKKRADSILKGKLARLATSREMQKSTMAGALEHPVRRTQIFGLTISAFGLPRHGGVRKSERSVTEPLPICAEAG